MALLTAALLGLSAAATIKSQRDQGEYAARQNDVNAGLADEQAADAIARGTEAANRSQVAARSFAGTQRTDLAAQGLDTTTGTAAGLVSDTEKLSELDRLAIEHNAQREARGFAADASASRSAAGFARSSSRAAGRSTLLTAASQMWSIASPEMQKRITTPDPSLRRPGYKLKRGWGG